ncbi:histidine kinase [Phyllobacterium phragmitis]|uniref:histidine kinase n=1 Tax=Phyllobacterium phragmitis TaxID=2670329 RepID=A0A2S9IRG3_9HYPH|nr:AAA family ATPase [Phyllobacterium phragmitis]PRD43112.1 histidine kinase [Phyllobacterium phragmitis]
MNFSSGSAVEQNDGLQVLWGDSERVFCRGWCLNDDGSRSAVLVVRPAIDPAPPASLDRLIHEYALKDALDGASSVRPLALDRDSGRTALMLENFDGEPLDRLLGAPMEVESFLRLAIAIAVAVGKVHQCGLLHKDLKPANILVNSTSGEVKLTGFGIASRLTRERQSPEPPEMIAGTLAYMAPEQTGRMNRSIDSRSDLYALGITYCEMLTGVLPFTALDPMEWVHCHIARRPVAPSERLKHIPAPISAIVMKLLAKTAEDRYQTAGGVERDLRHCLVEWEARRNIADFPLGQKDSPDRLLIPEKLYGREREVETLLAAFDRVVSGGELELVLVAGYSGIGKSALVNELHKVLVPTRGLLAAGKFDQYKRDIPYSTLAQAFQSLVRLLLSKSDAELANWRDALLEALDQNGQLMIDLVPDLKFIIGEQPPVPTLPPQQAQSRFQLVFRRFIGVFARPEHPLALFLDDLQWLDTATLDLLEDLLNQTELRHLLLIGSYRDNEVDAAHPLGRKLQVIRNGDAKVSEITLAPLAGEHLGQLIADALRCEAEHVAQLTQLVRERTGGNPFFAVQFISALAEEGLLRFDHGAACWSWDIDRIHAKGYTDNVVNLMVEKLTRLPAPTLAAVQQLACVGNTAEIATLSTAFGILEEQVHADLWEAVRLELIERRRNSYKFIHDRVHEAAYSLIPEASRAPAHLRIGRLLAEQVPPEQRQETIFEIVNQLNRGADLITGQDEREQLAEFNLIAGRRAKASTAYTSACGYLRSGMSLLGDYGWTSRYELTFGLWLERAECEYLSKNFEEAERLIAELLARSASKVDQAAAYRIKVTLHVLKSEHVEAIAAAVECLDLFGIKIAPHPPREELDRAYAEVIRKLDGRPIESLVELPRLTDPDVEAAMSILATMYAPAIFTDETLSSLHLCHMVLLTLDYGVTGASAPGLATFGIVLGHDFGRYEEGYRFAMLARALVKRHRLVANEAMTLWALEIVSLWTRPVSDAVEAIRAAFRTGVEAGDLPMACYACNHLITDLLLRGDRLDDVWAESESGLAFARRARFRDVVDVLTGQQRFMLAMRGQTNAFGRFDGDDFVEAAYEQSLTPDRATTMICWYWIIKAQARFLFGSFDEAQASLLRAAPLLWSSPGHIQLLDYHFLAALTGAALESTLSAVGAGERRARLAAHCDRLARWVESCPANFADKHTLVRAELARLDNENDAAARLYEEAIRLAKANGFIQIEGMANELAARFYVARGLEQIAGLYFRNARRCYARWGAHGKVRQLDEMHPHLLKQEAAPAPTSTMGAPVEHLDLATVIKISQAVSGEMVLEKLLDTLMRTALEQAGAVRSLLVLSRGAELRIVAEAAVSGDTVVVRLPDEPVSPTALPSSVLQLVLRTQEGLILHDAAIDPSFAGDTYIRQHQARSVLCLPLINQGKLIGGLYLENNLAPHVFVPARIAVLKLLASQAAISLENTRLYRDLAEREARIRRLVDSDVIGIVIWHMDGRLIDANDAFLRMVQYGREDLNAGLRWFDMTPPEWQERVPRELEELRTTGTMLPSEKEFFRKDGSRVPVLIGAASFDGQPDQGVAYILDLTERKHAEAEARESERRYRETQAELAHANRVSTMGHLTASIAHEVRQPIAATVANAEAALRWLRRDPPDVEEVRQALASIVDDGNRAADIVSRIYDAVKKAPPRKDLLEINGAIREVIELTRGQIINCGILVRTTLVSGLPLVQADRVQLQQVILNLVVNAIEAMSNIGDEPRELLISTGMAQTGGVLVAVRDSGPGLAPYALEHIFDAFYTTKPSGIGLGLSICRSIVEAHGGRLWATGNEPRGAMFQFTMPAQDTAGDNCG